MTCRLKPVIAALLCVPLVMGNDGGCATTSMPTSRQIELNVPKSLRQCRAWPKSPGEKATNRQTAKFLVDARDAYLSCGGNNAAMDRLITKYEKRVRKLK